MLFSALAARVEPESTAKGVVAGRSRSVFDTSTKTLSSVKGDRMFKPLIAASLMTASLVGAGALTAQLGVTAAHAAAKHPAAAKKTTPRKTTTRQTGSTPHADGTVSAISG